MCLNFIILSILVITQVMSVSIINSFNQLKSISHEKCPFLEKSMFLEAEFLRKCVSVNEKVLNVSKITTQNEDAVLCLMYSSVFKHYCNIISLNEYNSDTIEDSLKTSTVKYVCDSLRNIPETVLSQPLITTVLNSSKSCNHLCTDYDDELKMICSLTSHMWTLSTGLELKQNEVKKPKISNHTPEEIKPHQPSMLDAEIKNPKDVVVNVSALLPNNNVGSHTQLASLQVSDEFSSKDNVQTSDNKSTGTNIMVPSPMTSTQSLVIDQNLAKVQMPKVTVDKTSIETTLKLEAAPVKQITTAPTNPNSLNKSNKDNPIDTIKSGVDVKKIEQKDDTNIDQPRVNDNYEEAGDDDFENFNDSPSKQIKGKINVGDIDIKDENIYGNDQAPKSSEVKVKPVEVSKPREIDEDSSNLAANFQNQNVDDSNSYFFSYFMMVCVLFICGYVAYHNKQKILALVLEGRKGRRPSRSRRPNSANYHKLDTTLEEAVTSSCNKNTTQVIY